MDENVRIKYNRLSRYYDILLFWTGGLYYRKAELDAINLLPTNISSCLITGGGTGYFMKSLLECRSIQKVIYLDISDGMLKKAREKTDSKIIEFRQGNWDQLKDDETFDVICLNYFIDLFDKEQITKIAEIYSRHLTKDGKIMVIDLSFRRTSNMGDFLFRIYLQILYFFFRISTGLQIKNLENWEEVFINAGYEIADKKIYARGFIKSILFSKK